jgi:biopolymer transport protein ExbB
VTTMDNLLGGTRRWWRTGLVGLMVLLVAVAPLLAQATANPPDAKPAVRTISLWTLIKAGGTVGWVIVLMSFAALALVIDHFISLRRENLIPTDLADRIEEHLDEKEYDKARELCEEDSSFLAKVVGSGLSQVGGMFGFFDMQNAMTEASEREIARLYRKLEILSFIAVTAPMLGLLGTVTGMIRSFHVIAATEGAAKPSQLATGIYEALVTTAEGLIVAIPVMFFVSFFRSRIDHFVSEAEAVVERLMSRFRHQSS